MFESTEMVFLYLNSTLQSAKSAFSNLGNKHLRKYVINIDFGIPLEKQINKNNFKFFSMSKKTIQLAQDEAIWHQSGLE